MKIFKSLKTGHAASDAFFQNQPVWDDTDMTRSCVLGFCIGVVVMAFVIVLCT